MLLTACTDNGQPEGPKDGVVTTAPAGMDAGSSATAAEGETVTAAAAAEAAALPGE